MAFLSTTNAPGTRTYGPEVLECNWNEERSRIASGERVYIPLMEGAVVRPFEPDVSIAPPTRVPGVPSDGKLCIPDRSRRSRATFDSSRQAADDGFREYQSTVLADFPPMEERGYAQVDDLSKTRSGPATREKNAMHEQARKTDGEAKLAKKMLTEANFGHTFEPRPSSGTGKVGFGSVVPRYATNAPEREFISTAMQSFRDPTSVAA